MRAGCRASSSCWHSSRSASVSAPAAGAWHGRRGCSTSCPNAVPPWEKLSFGLPRAFAEEIGRTGAALVCQVRSVAGARHGARPDGARARSGGRGGQRDPGGRRRRRRRWPRAGGGADAAKARICPAATRRAASCVRHLAAPRLAGAVRRALPAQRASGPLARARGRAAAQSRRRVGALCRGTRRGRLRRRRGHRGRIGRPGAGRPGAGRPGAGRPGAAADERARSRREHRARCPAATRPGRGLRFACAGTPGCAALRQSGAT
jgi:hypothetical protein